MWATPRGAEWLAHLAALSLLGEWARSLTTPLDGTSALLHAHSQSPPKLPVLELLWRRLTPVPLLLHAHMEPWPSAEHTFRVAHFPALLNKEAHGPAAHGATAATP